MLSRREQIPWPRVMAALNAGDLEWLRANAGRYAAFRLPDALQVCLLVRDREPELFERAAVRWLGRFALEAPAATISDLEEGARALRAMRTDANAAMERLSALCVRHQVPGC